MVSPQWLPHPCAPVRFVSRPITRDAVAADWSALPQRVPETAGPLIRPAVGSARTTEGRGEFGEKC